MKLQSVKKLVGRRPFIPLKVCLTDGSFVTVEHPELAKLLPYELVVYVQGDDSIVMEDSIHIALMHIVRIEPLKRKSAVKHDSASKN